MVVFHRKGAQASRAHYGVIARGQLNLIIEAEKRTEGTRESHKYSVQQTHVKRRNSRAMREENRSLASYGESSCVNAIVNAMRIARKIKYRHGYRSHLRLPLPPRTSSKGVSKLYTRLYTSILGCRVACMHTRVEGKRERERGTIALNSRFARSHFTNLHCNETGGRCR